MALITIQPSPSCSPGTAAKKRRRPPKFGAGTSDGPACCPPLVGESPPTQRISSYYPFCLSARFLVLATLVTCWVSFFQNFQSHHAALIPADGGWSASLNGVLLPSQQGAAAGGRYSVRRGRDGTDLTAGKGCQDTAAAAAPANKGPNNNNDERHHVSLENNGRPASAAAAAVPTAATTSTATNDDDDDDDESNEEEDEDDDEDIDLDTLQFVENRILLAPGELPGYTGWARPELTLAGHYEIIGVSGMKGQTHAEWSVDVECTALPQCRSGGSLFYLSILNHK